VNVKKCIALGVLICAALAVSAQNAQSNEWKEHIYSDEGFAITTPSEPVLQKETKETPVGAVEAHNYVVDLGNDCGVAINATDFKIAQGIDTKMVLEASKNGTAESMNGKITSEKEIMLGKNPGIQFELETESNHMLARYFFISGKLFALISIAPRSTPISPKTDRIFDSFRLVSVGK
jgi:hypothetical protein